MESRLYQLWFKLLYPTGSAAAVFALQAFDLNPLALYQADADCLRARGIAEKDIKKLMQKELSSAQALLDTCAQTGTLLLWQTDPCYPQALLSLPDYPSLLFALGDVSILNRNCVCIVGSRTASARGSSMAAKLTQHAVSVGLVPVTGAATGIDSVVLHTAAALRSPAVSVAAAGLDIIYPADVSATRQKLCAAGGCVISEFLFGLPARTHHFPIRNRLLPALSQGVFVAEAGKKSGALVTAELAKAQSKPVFAVPGYVDDPSFSGCNQLIRQGATIVIDPDADMASLLDSASPPPVSAPVAPPVRPVPPVTLKTEKPKPVISHPVLEKLCACLCDKSLSAEELIAQTGLSSAEVSGALVLGCLKDILEKSDDDRYFIK